MASIRQPALEPQGDWLEEVIDGEIWKLPPPKTGHANVIDALVEMLIDQLPRVRFRVRATAYGQGIQGGRHYTARIPDLAVFDREEYDRHMEQERERQYVWIAPRLIIECLSPANRKKSRLRLMLDYERIRTPEVWLIYPERRALEVYAHDGSELQHENTINTGVVRPRLCPADVNVDQLWKAFDRA
jgi:Uma2 family endonuclease